MNKEKLPIFLSSVENGFEEVAQSLIMRANYIETGDVLMNRTDVASRANLSRSENRSFDHDNVEIKIAIKRVLSLTDEQQEIIKKLRVLAEAFRNVK